MTAKIFRLQIRTQQIAKAFARIWELPHVQFGDTARILFRDLIHGKALMIGFVSVILMSIGSYSKAGNGYIPKDGFVPNKETALKIAEAVIFPIYGNDCIKNEKPFKIKLINNATWHIEGSLPPNLDGGVIEVDIAKADGRIIRMIHGR